MSALHEERQRNPETTELAGIWQAVIAVGASDMSDTVKVRIPGFNSAMQIGPCRWQARDSSSHPARGNVCLVAFDDRGECWVIAWWPFA